MKFTSFKTYIFEKFSEDSDPIKDLDIGVPFIKIKEGDIIRAKDIIYREDNRIIFNFKKIEKLKTCLLDLYIHYVVSEIHKINNKKLHIIIIPFSTINSAKNAQKEYFLDKTRMYMYAKWFGITDLITWDKYFKIIK